MTMDKKNRFIKTIVFDLGGVYFTRGTYLAIIKLMDLYNIDNFFLLYEIFGDRYQKEGYLLRKGLISLDEFKMRVGEKLQIPREDHEHIIKIWFGSYLPHYRIEELVKDLSQDYRLVIFSGNIKERVHFLNQRYGFLKFFNDWVFSYDYQKNKNDIEFYKELLKHINCHPSEALLIDDELKNVKIGQSVGLNAIQYYYTEHLIEQLQKLNIKFNLEN
ncbi:MAG: HAD family hydrolase [Promethearchaeati archaeon]